MLLNRIIAPEIEKELFTSKRVIVIYGPRRTGKTTLAKMLLEKYQNKYKTRFIQCETITAQQGLTSQDPLRLKQFIGEDIQFVVLDEAQYIKNIGINLKLLIDTYPDLQIIATGSSSFDLANEIKEPLTGRVWEFFLPAFTLEELEQHYDRYALPGILEDLILYGSYPQVILSSLEKRRLTLEEITQNYLYKDLLTFEGQKNSEFIFKLLQLLAFQIGSEVSMNELATKLERSKTLVEKHIDLLEKCFVIFRLSPLSRNLRNEIVKKKKIYFWDTGIRNALIQNFTSLSVRPDRGALWENFCIAERLKFLKTHRRSYNLYFWKSYQQQEIDYLEEYDGILHGYEIKWNEEKWKKPTDFLQTYPNSHLMLINRHNYRDFVVR